MEVGNWRWHCPCQCCMQAVLPEMHTYRFENLIVTIRNDTRGQDICVRSEIVSLKSWLILIHRDLS